MNSFDLSYITAVTASIFKTMLNNKELNTDG